MPTYCLSKSFGWKGKITDKVTSVCRMFGLTVDRLTERKVNYNCKLEIEDSDIVYLSGPSGAGKSVLLRELEKSIPAGDRINLDSKTASRKNTYRLYRCRFAGQP